MAARILKKKTRLYIWLYQFRLHSNHHASIYFQSRMGFHTFSKSYFSFLWTGVDLLLLWGKLSNKYLVHMGLSFGMESRWDRGIVFFANCNWFEKLFSLIILIYMSMNLSENWFFFEMHILLSRWNFQWRLTKIVFENLLCLGGIYALYWFMNAFRGVYLDLHMGCSWKVLLRIFIIFLCLRLRLLRWMELGGRVNVWGTALATFQCRMF